LDKLYAQAIVICDGNEKVAFLSVDAVYVLKKSNDKIKKYITENSDIKHENIIICATHAHTGGPVDDDLANKDKDDLYLEFMAAAAADTVILADKRLEDGSLTYAFGQVENISYVRNFIMKNGDIRSNPGYQNPDILKPFSEIDSDLSILYFKDENKNPKGALINFALHNCCIKGRVVSADYAGVLAKELKNLFGNDFVTVFISGTCGNINHINVKLEEPDLDHYKKAGKILADETYNLVQNSTDIIDGKISVLSNIVQIKRRTIPEETLEEMRALVQGPEPEGDLKISETESPQMKYQYALRTLRFFDGKPPIKDISLQVVKIGGCIIYCMPGEVFAQFGQMLKGNSPSKKNFIATLSNGSFRGYIPIREFFNTLVYEAQPTSAQLVEDAGYMMVEELLRLSDDDCH
jgi:hypothetical protein